jgi:hypothetical protein
MSRRSTAVGGWYDAMMIEDIRMQRNRLFMSVTLSCSA